MPNEIQATKFKLTNPPTNAPCDVIDSNKGGMLRKRWKRFKVYLTAEFASGKNMPSVKTPSNGPAVIPDKLLAA